MIKVVCVWITFELKINFVDMNLSSGIWNIDTIWKLSNKRQHRCRYPKQTSPSVHRSPFPQLPLYISLFFSYFFFLVAFKNIIKMYYYWFWLYIQQPVKSIFTFHCFSYMYIYVYSTIYFTDSIIILFCDGYDLIYNNDKKN